MNAPNHDPIELGYARASSKTRTSSWGLRIAIAFVVLLVLLYVGLTFLSQAAVLNLGEVCRANLRGIGNAMYIYAEANGGAFPPSFAELLRDGNCTPKQFVCPVSNTIGAPTSYVYVPGQFSQGDPQNVVVYEVLGNHADGRQVLFVDGHADFMQEPNFQAALARTNASLAKAAASAPASTQASRSSPRH
jgi:prepilin-type processing-associated H-X9-DG protein